MGCAAVICRRTSRQTGCKPDAEDWIWFAILPFAVYATITAIAAGVMFRRFAGTVELLLFAGATPALLLAGTRNAWDSVTHIVVMDEQQ
jgi:hypothetical protein